MKSINKRKIINDPVHGFINIPSDFIFDLIEHPVFQRLRRIKQLGLTHYVYPGATHTRFQHTIGAVHLMNLAINQLRSKNIKISEEGFENTLYAPYAPEYTPFPIKAIPYAMWSNRTPGDMVVWLNALK